MRLNSLSIRRSVFDDTLKGKIEFEEKDFGVIELVLDDAAVRQIIVTCSETLERVSRESAEKLREAIMGSIEKAKEQIG